MGKTYRRTLALYYHVIEWLYTGFGLVIGFIGHLQNVITNNYDSLTELHTPKITVTTAHVKSSRSLLAVVW
jgi:type IV secretory pathway TrbD component